MGKIKCDQSVLRLPVFFLSLYWFLAAYVLGNAIIFIRYGDSTPSGFFRQILLINVTYDLGTLLLAYGFVLVCASVFALLTIYVKAARVVILVGGSIMGVFLALFALFMSLYFSAAPCLVAGCLDVDYNKLVVLMIYLIYGNFVASQIPIAYALRAEPCSIKEFFQIAFLPGLLALLAYACLGLAVALFT